MGAPGAALPELQLTADLWRAAQTAVGARGFQFTDECAREMQNFIRAGAGTLLEDGHLQNPGRIAETKEALTRLLDKMIKLGIEEHSQTITGREAASTRMLDLRHFFRARDWFCPCYPFC